MKVMRLAAQIDTAADRALSSANRATAPATLHCAQTNRHLAKARLRLTLYIYMLTDLSTGRNRQTRTLD